ARPRAPHRQRGRDQHRKLPRPSWFYGCAAHPATVRIGTTCSRERRYGRSNVSAETRVIYKYHNRRLYDTAARRYTTLGELRQLVLDGADFVVREKQSQADITFTTLLNVLAL